MVSSISSGEGFDEAGTQENHRVVLSYGSRARLFAPGLFDHQLVKLRGSAQRRKLLVLHQLLTVAEAGLQRLAQVTDASSVFPSVA